MLPDSPSPPADPAPGQRTPRGGRASARRTAWATVALLWVVALFNYLDRNVIATLHGPIVADIPMTEAQFGLLTSVFLWVYGATGPACGYLADRFSRRKVIFASLLIWSAVTALTGHMHSFQGLLWTRALMGVSEACYLPAALALVSDHHRGPTRSRATAFLISGLYVGAALSGLGGYVAALGGWRTGYSLLGAIGVAYALVILVFLRDAPRAEPDDRAAGPAFAPAVRWAPALAELFGRPAFWILELLNALISVANWTIYAWMPAYLGERFHLGLGAAGLSATVYLQAASLLSAIAGGYWADRWSRRNPRARMFVPALGLCLAAPGLWAVGTSGVLGGAIAGIIAYGIGRGCYDANLMPMLRQLADERYSATGYGFLNCVGTITGGIMTYGSGRLRDAHIGLAVVFQGCAACILGTCLLLFLLKPRAAPGISVCA